MAGPIIKVTVAGDAGPLNVTMGQASKTLAKFSGDAVAAADAVVAANVKQRESLELLSKQYTAIAASASRGSKEQVAAAELAAASQKALQRELGSTTATIEKTKGSALSLSKVMNTALGFSVLGIGIKDVVSSAETFQQQMKLIQTQAGASAGEVKRMSAAVLSLGPAVGTAPEDLAKGLYHIESTGQRGAKALEELKVAAEGAKIGGANLEDVTNALNATIVSGIKGSGDYSHAMGILNATVGAGDMKMQDLADAMGTGLPAAAKIYGVSLRDVSGALAVFGDNNIRGADAGTKLTAAIRLMAAPSKAAAKELAGLGIGATQLGDDLRTGGLPKAIEDLKSHMEAMGLSASQQAVVLTRAFGGRQAGGILLLMGQLDRLKTKIKEVSDGGNSFGKQWEATTKTAAFSMDRFHASMQLLEITIGNQLIPMVAKVANSFSDWITKAQKTGELKRDIDQVKGALGAVGDVVKLAEAGFKDLNAVTGSTKKSVELLVGAFLAFKGINFAAGIVTQLTTIGTAAGEKGAAGKVNLLTGKLKALGAIGVITVGLDIITSAHTTQSGLHRYSGSAGWANLGNDLAGVVGLDWQGKSSSITGGGAALSGLTSGNAMKAFIAKQAAALGLDPKAVLGVATAEGGFSGAIGDGGHAFGPFQLNNAGGVLTGFQGDPQQYANSSAGIMYALKQMAAVAKGLKGMAAISAIVSKFERPADSTHDLQTAGSYYFGGASGASMADLQGGSGSGASPTQKQLDALGLGSGSGKTKKAYKVPQALQAEITKAQETFSNDVTQQHLATLTSLLSQEESLLKKHGDTAKAASVANQITEARKKLADAFNKAAVKDEQDAAKDITKATTAFGKGEFGVAAKYTKAEVASLTKAKGELEKAVAAAPAGAKGGYQKELDKVKAELKNTKGVTAWIEGVAKAISGFAAKLKAEGAQYTSLIQQRAGASALLSAGYFGETAQTISDFDTSILADLESQKTTLEEKVKAEKAKKAGAPPQFRAAIQATIDGDERHIQSLASEISSAMGTVESDLASAVSTAQGVFQNAVSGLQDDLDSQLQTLAEQASGYSADQSSLDAMQQQDTQTSLNDSLASAQKQLATDMAAGSDATQDQIDADKKAVAQAQRAIDENNLQIKATKEKAAADKDAAEKQKKVNTQLAGFEADLLSGKITAAEFQQDLAGLGSEFGLTIDMTGAQMVALTASAIGVERAFDALITWVNQHTGSNIPQVGGTSSGGYTGGSGGPGGTIEPGGSNIHTPGHQMAMGGILHAFSGTMVPGVPKASDYVPALLNGGEMILNAGQQMQLWKMIQSGSGFGSSYWQTPKIGGHNTPGASRGTTVVQNFHIAGTVVAEKELMQLIRTQSARATSRGTTVFGPN